MSLIVGMSKIIQARKEGGSHMSYEGHKEPK